MSASPATGPDSRVTARVPASAVAFAIEKPEPEVSVGERFSFAAFLAVALHAAVILGIGFALPDPPPPMLSLEVTLAQFASEQAPEEADFLAQADQQGSGSLDEARELTTDREAPLADPRITDALQPRPESGAPERPQDPRLDSEADSADAVETRAPLPAPSEQVLDTASLLAQARDLASLDARRSSEIQLDARGRRIRRLTSVSARSAVEAAYLESWRREVERIGNLNYPIEARQSGLEGDLRVLVEIEANGRLVDVRILESSGSGLLDESALKIVRLAAPFLPFPDDLRAEADVLQIVRTWQFRRRGFGSG
jgi:protein TonB